jgi:hypothetical protein
MSIFHVKEKSYTKTPGAVDESFGSPLQQENNILILKGHNFIDFNNNQRFNHCTRPINLQICHPKLLEIQKMINYFLPPCRKFLLNLSQM